MATLALCFYTATRAETFELGLRVFDTGELEGRSHCTKALNFNLREGPTQKHMCYHEILDEEVDEAMVVRVAYFHAGTWIQTLIFRSDIFEMGKLERRNPS
jgi:hypothetical protein